MLEAPDYYCSNSLRPRRGRYDPGHHHESHEQWSYDPLVEGGSINI